MELITVDVCIFMNTWNTSLFDQTREDLGMSLAGPCPLKVFRNFFSSVNVFRMVLLAWLLKYFSKHVQHGIQAFAKFKRPEYTRLHLREPQSQKFSLTSMRPKHPRTMRRPQYWWALKRSYCYCISSISSVTACAADAQMKLKAEQWIQWGSLIT